MHTLFTALRTLLFMSGFVWLWSWVALQVRPWDRSLGILPTWTKTPGLLLMAAGGILGLVCAGFFVVRGRGTPAPFDAPRRFVAAGPYRYVRNPMYIAGCFLLAGFGFYERSPSIVLFSLPWLLIAHLFVIGYEEPTLRDKFGSEYEDYCRIVPRWIPKL
ncbi:MAG: isoprenylcysteine carboxylmethyltransferase family protein [Acidobacteria bacterium]|nr:isoprenylcysteine carboxylmethyltransferase family protein [Acidobacteriota bacterium]